MYPLKWVRSPGTLSGKVVMVYQLGISFVYEILTYL